MRSARLNWLGALVSAAMVLAACGEQQQKAANSIPGSRAAAKALIPGVLAEGAVHKLQVSPAEAEAIKAQGGHLIADYGAYQLFSIDDEALAQLKPSNSLELKDDYNQILLNAGAVDTTSPSWGAFRGVSKAAGKQLHLVQFAGPVRPEWLEGLKASGARVVSYIPNNAYLVWGGAEQLTNLSANLPAVSLQWEGEYLNDFKLDPSVNTVKTDAYAIQLVEDAETNPATVAQIHSLQHKAGVEQSALGYLNVVAYLDRAALDQIAQRPDVVSIHPRPEPKLNDERQDLIISGNVVANGPSAAGYLAWLASKGFNQAEFDASGFGVDLSDSGIDNGTQAPNHFGLYVGGDVLGTSRIVYNRLEGTPNSGSTIQGCDGHGNLNSHIIGGYSAGSAAPFADAQGYAYGLGVAPFVRIGSSVVFDPGTFTSPSYENLQSDAYNDGMRISSNSWGSSANTYTSDAQRYDALVRDAEPTGSTHAAAGNQEMVIVFAAGNGGSGANTVGNPGTGKNVITVGATEGVQPFGAADQCGVTDAQADSFNDIAFFSSRGPTSDGRIKPDLVGPGTHISGGVAQTAGQHANPPAVATGSANSCFDATGVCAGPGTSNFWPLSQQWYTASSGTSHSTPATAGAAALTRQFFINEGLPPPSPAMTKAYLMNSARYLTGSGANDNLYSNNQGMGMLDLGRAFDATPRLLDDENPANLFTASGQTRTFSGQIGDSTQPFRVTLAWTDAPGSTTGNAYNNNLDLTVTVGANTYKGNVFTNGLSVTGGVADVKNNVESVFLPAGTTGAYSVTVNATNINSDGVPGNASAVDQDFALVVYNSCATTGALVSGVSATASAPNQIDIAWTDNGGPTYRVYRATVSGGPYTKVGETSGTSFSDTTVSGGSTYFYVVRAVACGESADSAEVSATATGNCTLTPVFAGLTSATNAQGSTCTDTLSWAAATPTCGGTITYSVYRSPTAGFTPSNANRIATGISGTSFSDDLNLAFNTKYYYVVRATETGAATVEEQNTVTKAVAPTGAISTAFNYFDDLDSNRPANATSYWIATTTGTSGTVNLTTGCHYQSATKSWRYGAASTACGGTYPVSSGATLSLGGNGSTAGINGFTLPAAVGQAQLTFNLWYSMELQYDGAWLAYSTTGAGGPWTNVGDSPSATAPYIVSGGYDNTLNGSGGVRVWTGSAAGANQGANGSLKAVTVDASALAGQTVWFAWKFSDDFTVNKEGTYLDDVRFNVTQMASCSTNTPPPGPPVAYQFSGLPASLQAGQAYGFNITAYDAVGQVATGYSGFATLSSSDPQATISSGVNFGNGVTATVATFGTVGTQTITATDASQGISGTGSTSVTPGAPTHLVLGTQPSNGTAGVALSPAVAVKLTDDYGNVTTGNVAVTVALDQNPGGATLSGTTTQSTGGGSTATFADLSLDKATAGYTLVATASGFAPVFSNPFSISPAAPAALAFVTQPGTIVAGDAFAPAVTVAVTDAYGNFTTSGTPVTLSLAPNPANATAQGTTTVGAVNGIATFDNATVDATGTGYQLIASSLGLSSVTSGSFDVTPAVPFEARFAQQPVDGIAGSALAPVTVALFDRFGNAATNASNVLTISLFNDPTNASLGGTLQVAAVNGVATFDTLSLTKAGSNYVLGAGGSGLHPDVSVGFDIAPAAGAVLVVDQGPSSASAGDLLAPTVVELQDAYGNLLTTASDPVTVTLAGAAGTLNGTATVSAVNGVATFSDLSINQAASGYLLDVTAGGYAPAATASFDIAPAAASQILFTSQPGNVAAGASFSPSIAAVVEDTYGNAVPSTITLDFATNPGGATLSGTTTLTASGVADFADISLDKPGTGYSLTATSGALSVTSSTFDVSTGAASKLVVTTPVANASAGANLGTIVVEVRDVAGNVDASSSANVTLSLLGPSNQLVGTTTLAATSGSAIFSGLSIQTAGTGYTLVASASGLSDGSSNAFDIAPGAPAAIQFKLQPGTHQAATSIQPVPLVWIVDAFGNRVADATNAVSISIANNPGSATLSGPLSHTPVSGTVGFNGLSLDHSGSGYTLQASAAGLTSAISAPFDITVGPPAKVVIQSAPSSSTAGSTLAPVVALLEDAEGNVIGGNQVVTLSLGANNAGGSLLGPATVTAVNGVATFNGVSIRLAGDGYTLIASAEGYGTAESSAFSVAPGAAARYDVHLPQSVTAHQAIPLSASAFDVFGNLAASYATSVTVTTDDSAAVVPAGAVFSNGTLAAVDLTFATPGLHTVTLTDSANPALTASAQVNVTPVAQPTVQVTSPAGGAKVSGKTDITAKGAVAQGTTIQKIEILVDGKVVGTGTTETVTASWDPSNITLGSTHTIVAIITDSAGNVVQSAPVGVVVDPGGCGCSSGNDAANGALTLLAFAGFLMFRRRRLA